MFQSLACRKEPPMTHPQPCSAGTQSVAKAAKKKPRVLLVNASVRGHCGNSHRLLDPLEAFCRQSGADVERFVLASFEGSTSALGSKLIGADAFVFITGCYWSSPGSVMQRFLEVATQWELAEHFLGKPAAVVVTMHSVGGLESARAVASTLQLLGCLLPPLGVVALSQVAQMALGQQGEADLWRVADLQPLAANLLHAARLATGPWATWPIARAARAAQIMRSGPLASMVERIVLPDEAAVLSTSAASDAALAEHCRRTVKTVYHPAGTARMGTDNDPMAVLRSDLTVRGIKGLRVFDTSAWPTIISGNTVATTYAVADRGVALMMGESLPGEAAFASPSLHEEAFTHAR